MPRTWLISTIALLAVACSPPADPELTPADHLRLAADQAIMLRAGTEVILGEGIPAEATRAAVFEDGLVVEVDGQLIHWSTGNAIAEGRLIGTSRDGTLLAYFSHGILHTHGAGAELEFEIACQAAEPEGVWDRSNIYLGLVCGDRLYRIDASTGQIHEHHLPIQPTDISVYGEGFGLLAIAEDGQRNIHRTTCHPDLHTLSEGLPAPIADVIQYVGTAEGGAIELMLTADGQLWMNGASLIQLDDEVRYIGEIPGSINSRFPCRTDS